MRVSARTGNLAVAARRQTSTSASSWVYFLILALAVAAGCYSSALDAPTASSTPKDGHLDVLEGPHDGEICSVHFSANGKHILSVGKDHKIVVWDVGKRKPVRRITEKRSAWSAQACISDALCNIVGAILCSPCTRS